MKIQLAIPEMQALPQRLQRLTGDETIRGIVFQAVESALQDVLDDEACADVKRTVGLSDRRYDTMSKYPMQDFLRFQHEAASRMARLVGGFDEAIYRIGAAAVSNFFASLAGKTMALLAGKDPTRLLSAVPNGYRLLTSYGQRTWTQTSPTTGTFRFEGELLGPVHNFGSFDTALRLIRSNARFRLQHRSVVDFDFHLEW